MRCACSGAAERLLDYAVKAELRSASSSPSTGRPASTQASSPPASGRTLVNPLSISARATRAAEASLGHVQ